MSKTIMSKQTLLDSVISIVLNPNNMRKETRAELIKLAFHKDELQSKHEEIAANEAKIMEQFSEVAKQKESTNNTKTE